MSSVHSLFLPPFPPEKKVLQLFSCVFVSLFILQVTPFIRSDFCPRLLFDSCLSPSLSLPLLFCLSLLCFCSLSSRWEEKGKNDRRKGEKAAYESRSVIELSSPWGAIRQSECFQLFSSIKRNVRKRERERVQSTWKIRIKWTAELKTKQHLSTKTLRLGHVKSELGDCLVKNTYFTLKFPFIQLGNL